MRTLLLIAAGFALTVSSAYAQSTTLRIGYPTSKESHNGVGATAFCDAVESGTAGRYRCQHFPSSALGGEREQIEAVQLGTQDLVNTSTGPLGNFVPEVKVLDIPFLFRDYDHARKVLDGPIGDGILKKFESKGLVALAWTENGFRHISNSKRDIVTPADAAGLKIRTMENKVHMDGFRTFGLLPTPMAWPEVFVALQQGTVDGQENSVSVMMDAKISQVQKHLSLTNHVYSPGIILLSAGVWKKLSDADKKVFVESGRKASLAQRAKINSDENRGVAQLEKEGMKVVRTVDGAAFRAALRPAYEGYAKEFGAVAIKAIQDTQ
jgi:tripartite ATP-independent transporter DctP family solute receptor